MTDTGLIIRTQDARRLPKASRYVLPGTLGNGLRAFHIMMDGLDAGLRNWAPGYGDAASVGSVVEGDEYLSMQSYANYLRTDQVDLANGTLLWAGRSTSASTSLATAPLLIGNYSGVGALGGSWLYNSTNSLVLSATYQLDSGGAPTPLAATVPPKLVQNAWTCAMAHWTSTGQQAVYNKTLNSSALASVAGTRVLNGVNYGIGSGGAHSAFQGTSDALLAMIWDRVLTAPEQDAAYSLARRLAATAGISL